MDARRLTFSSLLGLALATSRAEAQEPPLPAPTAADACDPSWLAAGSITARQLAVPSPSFPASRCVRVDVAPLEIAAPVAVPGSSACEIAVLHRRTIVQSEVCGNDIHFDPIVEVGVVVLRRAGRGWRRIASGMLDVDISPAATLAGRDTDGDQHDELVLDGRFVIGIERRRVRVVRALAR